ncbi:D-glycerate dehydrogenase [Virgibacillus sp. 179-BFC.A HS]|uniref:D-glycerate dehydrogenase n=1 Tax=Tigheibacillus jepli TaxID=3035914 RepID=A0ABU5CKG4_9BACI|nr:D-glycerate dehydrogenase [Virgibacillus sp. 179-BFC.A HS]MDY0406801.1 D-glycerate dehydrogenase [Virgibacillus sp. 179-BFC.A HS]
MKVNQEMLDRAPKLRIVSNISAGYDNLDIKELTSRGIMATNTPDVLTDTTADAIFGLLLATARRIPELDAYVKAGQWTAKLPDERFGVDVHHKTLGIIGMGRIGKAIAERAHFGFKNVLYHNRTRNSDTEKELEATYVSLDDLLQQSDFVCLMAPLTDETIGLMGKREFDLMKETAVFINGARGSMVVEADLIHALQNKTIRAAGLDVYQNEPLPLDSPLLQLENVVTMPHYGSATQETRYKMAELAVDNLIKGIHRQAPPSLIDKAVLAHI